ncbi:hypothetical protein EDD18DRAFT_1205617 [Armillaria luteobubalina]|uniref:Glucose-methanol-choline oxidoreductase N-terminal domain-containing protein n=1 Tax=Armillaria luteobubalina TaxID=153913 RepID=A0AA39UIN0_9AGAR|nr:hypothetical protein EDD18DRAFT_1205617 [Armillaria luteobubalina]
MFDGRWVKNVIFEGTRAVGVEYTVYAVRASRLVVASAGVMGSSLILERPGIGATSILGKFSIDQVADFPGVGKVYGESLDHPFLITPYIVDANTVTTEALSGKDPELWGKFKSLMLDARNNHNDLTSLPELLRQ